MHIYITPGRKENGRRKKMMELEALRKRFAVAKSFLGLKDKNAKGYGLFPRFHGERCFIDRKHRDIISIGRH